DAVLYRGRGCENCKGTGYYGRTGLYELMVVDDEIRELILSDSFSTVSLREKSREKGMMLLSEDGVNKALAGITTLEEVSRVCEEYGEAGQRTHVETKVEPSLNMDISGGKLSVPAEVDLQSSDVDGYQERMASWLSRKKRQVNEG
ncbi:MAG: hypothetical protein PHC33_04830, partial [Candidatus Omnitrophica bacterium]|nr:hypothetical protein [Candidatus Omnitrophota bacterium]